MAKNQKKKVVSGEEVLENTFKNFNFKFGRN